MTIRLPKCKIRLFVFFLYNLCFVLYMQNMISNVYYLVTLALFSLMNGVMILNKKIQIKQGIKEFRLGIIFILVFFIISIIMQLFNKDLELKILFNDIIRLGLPIINAFLFVNTIEKADQKIFFDIFLFRFILQFILINASNISLQNILSISWSDSSSAMESSLAHDFMIMEMYFLMKKERKKAFISMVFCMLSMKRLSFILAPLFFIFSKCVNNEKEVKQVFLNILKLVAIISPLFMLMMYSNEFQNFLLNSYNIDLNSFMSGRVQIYQLLVNNIPYFNGLGSVNAFLGEFAKNSFGTTWNGILHNDFLRIYFETTIIGVIVFSNNLVEMSKKNYWHYMMVAYLILVAITSHILNYFSVWVTLYMIIMSYENKKIVKNE